MKNKQKGFIFVEVILLVAIASLLVGTGYYVWQRHYHSSPVLSSHPNPVLPNPRPVNNCAGEKELTPDCAKHLSGWTTYKSSHSSLSFSHPSSWEAVDNKLVGDYELESVTMYGPNNFQLDFKLATNHVNPALSCMQVHFGTVVPLSNQFVIVPTLDSANKSNVDTINLMANTYKDTSNRSGCGLDFYPNPVEKNMGFTFSGSYIKQDNNYGGTYLAKPESGYFNLGEVQTAKAVFESLKQ